MRHAAILNYVCWGLLLVFCAVNKASAVSKIENLDSSDPIGDFALVAADGSVFNQQHLQGRWSIMTVGFTSCPDICPFVLSNLSDLSKVLYKEHALKTEIIFVAVDPARDTPILAEYVKHFGDNVTGVTGSQDQLKRIVDAIGASFELEKSDSRGNYSVKHTAFAVLISPAGELVARLNPPLKTRDIAAQLIEMMGLSTTIAYLD